MIPEEISRMKALRDDVLVEIEHDEDNLVSGILHTMRKSDKNIEPSFFAKVISVGPGVVADLSNTKRVIIRSHVNMLRQRYVFVQEKDILAEVYD